MACSRCDCSGDWPWLLAGLAIAPALPARQQYPAQDIHFICAFPPGSGADVLVRYFAEKVRPLTGKNVIVENRSGAGGNIAIEYVAARQARRLHGPRPWRERRCRQHEPVQEAAGRRRQDHPDRRHASTASRS